MVTEQWLKTATKTLSAEDIQTARLDALILLEDILGVDRAIILAHPELEINNENQAKLKKLLKERAKHVPLAYLRGKCEFYGREFIVTPAVLQPRPESETMIELLKELVNQPHHEDFDDSESRSWNIADVGCGSGALGITAMLEVKNSHVELLDISEDALKVAKFNVDIFTPGMTIKKSDLILGATQKNHILLCNLPYVPDAYQINRAAEHEPQVALFGGPDGLDLYRRLFEQITKLQNRPLYLLFEALSAQHAKIIELAKENGYQLQKTSDLIQLFFLK